MNLPSMKYGRKRGDMVETYKYTHGLTAVSLYWEQQQEDTNYTTQAEEMQVLLKSAAYILLVQS